MSNRVIIIYVWLEISIFFILLILLGYGAQVEKISAIYYLVFYSVLCRMPLLWLVLEEDIVSRVVYFGFEDYVSYPTLLLISRPFFMKLPLYFFHVWLPKVHVEAPTATSIVLAGLLLKIGSYGIIQFIEYYIWNYLGFLYSLSLLGIVMASVFCIFVRDIKLLVAFSSVVHIRFLFLCLIINSALCYRIRFFIIFGHGLVSSMLFYIVGELYIVFDTRIIYLISGVHSRSSLLAVIYLIIFLVNVGAPLSITFYSEVMGLRTVFGICPWSFWILLGYFILSFYYGISVVVSMVRGVSFINIISNSFYCVLPILFVLGRVVFYF